MNLATMQQPPPVAKSLLSTSTSCQFRTVDATSRITLWRSVQTVTGCTIEAQSRWESLRSWKLLLGALNEGFDRRSVDLLLLLDRMPLMMTADGVLQFATLIAADYVAIARRSAA
jgi:hypothetical protein